MSNVRVPIDPERLQHVLAPTLGASRTLPAEAYLAPEVLAWEVDHFFRGGWVCVGRSADLAVPGDQHAVRIGDEGLLLVRDERGALNAFANTCRHRGHELLEGGAMRNLRAIKCPYHAWVYGLDGSLKGAPRFGDVPGFDKAEYPLVPTRVAEWNGWIGRRLVDLRSTAILVTLVTCPHDTPGVPTVREEGSPWLSRST